LRNSQSKAPASDASETAVGRALKYLGHRARTEAEVRTDLIRHGYSPAVTQRALEKLRKLDYVNDEAFARDWVRARTESRGYGPRKIEHELSLKGVEREIISRVLREIFQPQYETATAKKLLERNFPNDKLKDARVLRRAGAFLLRRGYSQAVVDDLLQLSRQESLHESC
jgi:regulatory protein